MRKKNSSSKDISVTLRLSPSVHQQLENLQYADGKNAVADVIMEAIHAYLASRHEPGGSPYEVLTPRQLEVLRLIADGITSREIAVKLGISIKTVEMHRMQLMANLGIHNVAGVVRYALRSGLTPL